MKRCYFPFFVGVALWSVASGCNSGVTTSLIGGNSTSEHEDDTSGSSETPAGFPFADMLSVMPTKPQHARRYSNVPALLRELRDEAGLTQRELVKRFREPQSWVYKCENGIRRIDVAEFLDWCRACKIAPEKAMQRLIT